MLRFLLKNTKFYQWQHPPRQWNCIWILTLDFFQISNGKSKKRLASRSKCDFKKGLTPLCNVCPACLNSCARQTSRITKIIIIINLRLRIWCHHHVPLTDAVPCRRRRRAQFCTALLQLCRQVHYVQQAINFSETNGREEAKSKFVVCLT